MDWSQSSKQKISKFQGLNGFIYEEFNDGWLWINVLELTIVKVLWSKQQKSADLPLAVFFVFTQASLLSSRQPQT